MLLKKPPYKKILSENPEYGGVTLAKIMANAIILEAIQENGKIKIKKNGYGKFI